ncbi:hypothetical protein F4803DRAFT_546496 [Xylaria telfairii]|nr:hypothetical protein F4803DRAFT_546496 [Xylaria telfairii]
MSAVTAILNQHPAAPDNHKINVFYSATNNCLAVQQRNENDGRDPNNDLYEPAGTDQPGHISNPSSLASVDYRGVSHIFGFVQQVASQPTKHDIAILSPVYRPIRSTQIYNTSITAASVSEKASVLYLTGGNGNSLHIEEKILSSEQARQWTNHAPILAGSALAAYYLKTEGEPQHIRVIFQGEIENKLYDLDREAGSQEIENTSAKPRSSLATTVAGDRVYLYFVNQHGQLQRVIKDGKTKRWGSPSAVKDTPIAADATQLAAVSFGEINHIFYSARDQLQADFQHVFDYQ